jgi:importin-4
MAIGCFAELLEYMGSSAAAHLPSIAPVIQAGLADPSPAVRRNACFAVGMMVCCAPEAMVPHFPALLGAVAPFFEVSHEQDGALADNACSCVARMIKASTESVPTEQVLPALLGALPLKQDFTENENVYSCLAGLLEGKHPHLMALLPQALVGVSHGLGAEGVSDATRGRLRASLGVLTTDPSTSVALAAAMGQLPTEVVSALQAL